MQNSHLTVPCCRSDHMFQLHMQYPEQRRHPLTHNRLTVRSYKPRCPLSHSNNPSRKQDQQDHLPETG